MAALAPKFRGLQPVGRRGITLLELLVVMVILSIVTAASIPMLNTGVESRRVREAARLVASYIGAAKSRAIETGSPAGVMIQRYAGQNYALTLVGVEVPQPYAGDSTTSTATINAGGQLTGFPLGDSGWTQTVRVGDIIRLGYQGRSYMLLGNSPPPSGTNPLPTFIVTATNKNIGGQLLSSTGFPGTVTPVPCNLWATDGSGATPPASSAGGMPFQISRQPIKSAVQPLQLPEGTVIDLYSTILPATATTPATPTGTSGIGLNSIPTIPNPTWVTTPFAGNFPYPNPIITFGPTGAVNLVYYDANPPQHLKSTLFLLIGRRDGMEDLGFSSDQNILHHSSMWVAVGPQSGLVVTAENLTGNLATARQFAQAAASLGGR